MTTSLSWGVVVRAKIRHENIDGALWLTGSPKAATSEVARLLLFEAVD